MSPFTPVNPEWKCQNNAAARMHSLEGQGPQMVISVPFTYGEGKLDAFIPQITVEKTGIGDFHDVDNVTIRWEDSIDLATLYGFSDHEKQKRARLYRVSKSQKPTKKEQNRLESFREKLTQALGDHPQPPKVELHDTDHPTAASDPGHVTDVLLPGVPPANVHAEDHQISASVIPRLFSKSIRDVSDAHTPSVNDAPTPGPSDAEHYGSNLIPTKHTYLARSVLPSPPLSSGEPTPPATPQEQLLPDTFRRSTPQAEPTISYLWTQWDHTIPDPKIISAPRSSSTKETPHRTAHESTIPLTANPPCDRPPLLDLKFRRTSRGISRVYRAKALPPLLSTRLPSGLHADRLFARPQTDHENDTDTELARDALAEPEAAEQSQKREKEAEDLAQQQYDATARNNWRLAAIPTPTSTPSADAPSSFTRLAVLRAATSLVRSHAAKREGCKLSSLSVRFDDTAARRDLAEWRGCGE